MLAVPDGIHDEGKKECASDAVQKRMQSTKGILFFIISCYNDSSVGGNVVILLCHCLILLSSEKKFWCQSERWPR